MEIKLPDIKTDTGFTLFQKNKNKANLDTKKDKLDTNKKSFKMDSSFLKND